MLLTLGWGLKTLGNLLPGVFVEYQLLKSFRRGHSSGLP